MNRHKTNRRYQLVLLLSLAVLTSTLAGTLVNAALSLQVVA
jgi:hypothetical protein